MKTYTFTEDELKKKCKAMSVISVLKVLFLSMDKSEGAAEKTINEIADTAFELFTKE